MAVQKGKQGTKGQKQIVEENTATLNFYRNMILGANGIYLLVTAFLDSIHTANIVLFILSSAAYIGSYQFMAYMCKPKFTDSGQLLDSGVDLNMEGGIAEHVKDLIILTSGCQLMSLISKYFWLLWLLAPIRGFWILWVSILSPWFFQPGPAPEVDEKKQKKMERRMKRHS
ncbi:hypothetical protein J437_LFUL010283 [Ladona fulva]|uniref:Transmembrane protein 208 n=1 Tax=Ladona fulva TaxID=123851 RepID=A0A8K0P0W1_LADFU|nr:hypothetical protein J437_LFUL010283 [Ladona fulva]